MTALVLTASIHVLYCYGHMSAPGLALSCGILELNFCFGLFFEA